MSGSAAARGWLFALLLGLVTRPAGAEPTLREAPSHAVTRVSIEASGYHDTDHVDVVTPTIAGAISDPVAGWSIEGSYLVDAVSAASVDIVSSATPHWTERRHVGAGTFRYKPHDVGIEVGGGVSREPDYLALAAGGALTWDTFEKNLTAMVGFSYGDEMAGRSGTSLAIVNHHFTKNSPRAGFTLVLNPTAVLEVVGEIAFERGDQSKPYRYVPLFTRDAAAHVGPGTTGDVVNAVREKFKPEELLPLARDRYAITSRLSQRFSGAALRLEERLYSDDWGLKATTTDLRYIVDLTKSTFVWPHLRLHLQSPVAFWQRTYVVTVAPNGQILDLPPIRTGDRELGPLHSFTAGGGLRFMLGGDRSTWSVTIQGEVVYTKYSDALYISDRMSFFGALGLESTLD
jgi:hypothetical protein